MQFLGWVQVYRFQALFACLALCFSFTMILSVKAQAANTSVSDIRFGGDGKKTRVVIDLARNTKPDVFLLANPARVVVDLPKTNWKAKIKRKPTGLVKNFRHGNFKPDVYRLVLELKGPAKIASRFNLPPKGKYGHRFVLDLQSTNSNGFAAAVKNSKPRATVTASNKPVPLRSPSKRRTAGGKKVIVLDPGHGGIDPGTLGRFGKNESILTLLISRELKKQLEATGRYKVYLTRNSDIYIKHRRRFEFARAKGANLFVSVHVDTIANPKVRGGSVYTLSERSSDAEAARLAARENKSDIIAGIDLQATEDDVSSILIDLAQRETMNYSAELAEILVGEMRKEVKMLKTGHRFASLMVLKAPDMPSVLIETGFQTNRQDAKILNSAWGRRKIAKGIAKGIDKWFNTASRYAQKN